MPLTEQEMKEAGDIQLLEKAVEEAAELIQAIQKYKLHGPRGKAPNGTEYDNVAAIMSEARQISDIMRIWGAHHQGINWGDLHALQESLGQSQLDKGVRPIFTSLEIRNDTGDA